MGFGNCATTQASNNFRMWYFRSNRNPNGIEKYFSLPQQFGPLKVAIVRSCAQLKPFVGTKRMPDAEVLEYEGKAGNQGMPNPEGRKRKGRKKGGSLAKKKALDITRM